MSSVRVLFVSSHAARGGSERYLELLLDGLGESWISGVASLEEGPLTARLRECGRAPVVIPTSGARRDAVRASWRLRQEIRTRRPDVIHANGVKAAVVSELAAARSGVPVIWVKHDFSGDGAAARLVAGRSCQIVCVTEAVAESLRPAFDGRVHVVPHGIPRREIDRAMARNAVARLVGVDRPERYVALVGRLEPGKGQLDLIDALESIRDRVPAARVVLVGGESRGDPGFRREIERRLAETATSDNVTLVGERESAIELIAGCDVLAVPSVGARIEGASLVALEALSVGTPVVAYASGGLPEVVADARCLVPPGDSAALGTAIADVLVDPDLRVRLACAGRRRARESFSHERMVAAMQERYREAAAR